MVLAAMDDTTALVARGQCNKSALGHPYRSQAPSSEGLYSTGHSMRLRILSLRDAVALFRLDPFRRGLKMTIEECREFLRYDRLMQAAVCHEKLAWERGGSRIWLTRAANLLVEADRRCMGFVFANTQPYTD